MAKNVIRFCIERGSLYSVPWLLWNPEKKMDLYLTKRSLGGCLKASLHLEANIFQYSFTRDFKTEMKSLGRAELPDQLARWDRREVSPGCTLAVQILVPPSVVHVPTIDGNVYGVPAPDPKKAVEFSVLITSPDRQSKHCPGYSAMRTRPVGHFQLPNGEVAWVVHRTVDFRPGKITGRARQLVPSNIEKGDKVFTIVHEIVDHVLVLRELRIENAEKLNSALDLPAAS